jgi:hypothetical protein
MDGRALEVDKDVYFFTAGVTPGEDFTSINQAVKSASILKSIGKPLLIGYDTNGIILSPDLIGLMKLASRGKQIKDKKTASIEASSIAKEKALEAFKLALESNKRPSFMEIVSMETMKEFLTMNFGREILTLLEARYEARGRFGKPGQGSAKWVIVVLLAVGAFILFILFGAPLLQGAT